MTLYLVDGPARPYRPLSWTRPLSELLFGAETFRERIERLAGRPVAGVFSHMRFEATPFSRLGGRPLRVNPRDDPAAGFVLLDSTYVPASSADPALAEGGPPARFWLDGAIAGARLGPREAAETLEALLAREDWRAAARSGEDVELPGFRPGALHRLVAGNAERIADDLGTGAAGPAGNGDGAAPHRPSGLPSLTTEGPAERLHLSPGAEIAGPVHVDLREGPVRVDGGVRVEPFTTLRGPLVVRAGSVLLGSDVGWGTTLGPGCRVRGEVRNAVFLGMSNKAHEGFVGDSYVGEWVNLGAGTTTSNLKNNYGAVRLRIGDEVVETGLLKLGSVIGDHVKTGIGTLLPTGCWIGPGTNLYGTRGPAPAHLPAFSWGAGTRRETHRLEAFLESARVAMERRGVTLDADEAGMLRAVFRTTESERIAT
ncbi:MAG TPA: hypothetical protein VIC56_00355 [Gemmatimonadota bacterium]